MSSQSHPVNPAVTPSLRAVVLMWLSALLLLALGSGPAIALVVRAAALNAPGVAAQGVQANLSGSILAWQVEQATSSDLAMDLRKIRGQCTLTDRHCQGSVSANSYGQGSLRADWQAKQVALTWRGGQLSVDFSRAEDWQLIAKNWPLPRLQARVQQAWTSLSSLGGGLDFDLHILPDAVRGQWQVRELSFDQLDGSIAGASLSADGSIEYGLSNAQLRLDSTIDAGEMLIGPIYRQLDQPLNIRVNADLSQPALRLPDIQIREGGHLSIKAGLSLTEAGDVQELALAQLALQWPSAQAWTSPVLANAGFDGLALSGSATVSGRWQPGGWQAGLARIENMTVTDPEQRVQATGLELDANIGAQPSLSQLSWQDLALFGIPFSGGTFKWLWTPEQLTQQDTLQVQTLGGNLILRDLSRRQASWQGSVAVQGLDFAALSERFGWPAFGGKVSADIRDFTFAGGQLKIPNDIEIAAFSGRIGVQHLSTERLFGDSPALSADIRMNDLDLKALTAAMSFGEIEGTLDGYINGLRLLNWTPLGFDARFQSKRVDGKKQKISRRAVQGLSNIGGASLNNALINLVDSFSYANLGIACRLKEDVCQMDGIDSDGSGYTIVQGSGLPRLTVRGYQRRVNWPVMLRRLQAAASGTGPIIE